MEEMTTLPSFTAEQTFLMKKALYYDFMLFNRNQKPFNTFLIKNGLKNTMYTPQKSLVAARYSDLRASIIRYDVGLHTDLSSPNRFYPNDNVNLAFISEKFKNPELDQSIFNPETSEQIDQGIKTLVDNFQPGAPLYDCSRDTVMGIIIAGKFDEVLSDENKDDMMRICAAAPAPAPTGLGGKKKRRSKNKSKLKKTKKKTKKLNRSKRRSSSKRGGAPASYVGSIQGEFINHKGQQLFRNPTGGIA